MRVSIYMCMRLCERGGELNGLYLNPCGVLKECRHNRFTKLLHKVLKIIVLYYILDLHVKESAAQQNDFYMQLRVLMFCHL